MKKLILFMIVVSSTIIVMFSMLGYKVQTEINDIRNNIRNKVGKKMVLNSDTLMIIDYSIINNNYKLSNGNVISTALADKLIIKTNNHGK